MALTIEQAHKLNEMRVRFLQNTQQGLPPEHGFTVEELSEGLAMIRQSKTAAAQAAAAKGKKTKEANRPKVDLSETSKAFFGDLDLDADDEEPAAAEGATPPAAATN